MRPYTTARFIQNGFVFILVGIFWTKTNPINIATTANSHKIPTVSQWNCSKPVGYILGKNLPPAIVHVGTRVILLKVHTHHRNLSNHLVVGSTTPVYSVVTKDIVPEFVHEESIKLVAPLGISITN